VHERAEVEEQVVKCVDRQTTCLVGILHGHNGRVEAVGEVAESRTAGLDHLLSALCDVFWSLAHSVEDVHGGWHVNIFEVTDSVWVGPWILHLSYVL